MNLIRSIFDFVKTLPAWQQDAARRLYEQPDGLSDSDYQELSRLAIIVLDTNNRCMLCHVPELQKEPQKALELYGALKVEDTPIISVQDNNMAKLGEVPPLNAEAVKDLYDLFGRCSDVFDGHDHSSEANEPVPMPNDMLNDIKLPESVIKRVKDTRKNSHQHHETI